MSSALALNKERTMVSQTSENFEYDDSVLNAAVTANEYTKRLTPDDITNEHIAEKGFAVAWGNYMRTRRSGSFSDYVLQQKQEIHSTAFLTLNGVVCSCGLIAPKSKEQSDYEAILQHAKGHIQTATRTKVSVYVVKIWLSKAAGRRQHYWCENCGDIGVAIPTETGKVSLIGLKAIRQSHKCSEAK
jgi:hypothetical protein